MSRRWTKTRGSGVSRRAFLGGAGAAIALPWLESVGSPGLGLGTRAARAATGAAGAPPCRMLYVYVPNGIHMPAWTPTAEGAGYDLPAILAPLAPVQDDVLVLTGLRNDPAKPDGPGDHAAGTGSFLTARHVKKTAGDDIRNGISVDQVAAGALGAATRFPSLQLGLEGGASIGGCDSGYSCAYSRNISWAGEQTPLPKLTNPELVFDRLFGGFDPGATLAERARRRRYRTSVLDYVVGDAQRLQTRLAAKDRAKVDEFLTGLRALEVRIEADEAGEADSCPAPDEPAGYAGDVTRRAEIFADLMVAAFTCDLTRVMTFMMGNAGSNRSYDFLGVSGAHHEVSHHQNLPANHAILEVIAQWEVTQLAYLLQALKAATEADGSSLLDHSMVFFSSEIEDGNSHGHSNLPVLLAGRAGGQITSGRHIRYAAEPPIANLFVSMLQMTGVAADTFGDDGTGPLGQLA